MTQVSPAATRTRSRFLVHMWIVMAAFAGLAMLQLVAPQLFPTGAEIVIKLAPDGSEWAGSGQVEAPIQGHAYKLAYHDHLVYAIAVGVRNTGSFAVQITGVDVSVGGGLSQFLQLYMSHASLPGAIRVLSPVESPTIQPGASAVIIIEQRFEGCKPGLAASTARYTLVGIKASALHVDRTVPIDLARPVDIVAQPGCPAG
jgi:hypothetical protein